MDGVSSHRTDRELRLGVGLGGDLPSMPSMGDTRQALPVFSRSPGSVRLITQCCPFNTEQRGWGFPVGCTTGPP